MATYTFGHADGSSKSGIGQHYRSYAVSSINSNVRSNIPKYSKINSVKYSFEAYQTISLVDTKADGKIFLGTNKDNEQYVIAGSTENVPKGSWVTIQNSTTNYVNTSGANTGEFKSTYGSLSLWYSIEAFLIRTMEYRKTYVVYDFTPPTYTISVASNNTNYGTVSGGGTWDVTISDFTKTITATPKSGYKFVKWSDGNTSASRSITISQNNITTQNTTLSLTATFESSTAKTNKIYVGTAQPSKIYVGTQEVKAVYVGTTKVYG